MPSSHWQLTRSFDSLILSSLVSELLRWGMDRTIELTSMFAVLIQNSWGDLLRGTSSDLRVCTEPSSRRAHETHAAPRPVAKGACACRLFPNMPRVLKALDLTVLSIWWYHQGDKQKILSILLSHLHHLHVNSLDLLSRPQRRIGWRPSSSTGSLPPGPPITSTPRMVIKG